MNGIYFKTPDFPKDLPNENIEEELERDTVSIFKRNVAKKVKIYATFPESNEWRDRELSGIIESASERYLHISEPKSGNWYLIPINKICYIEFEEKIN